MKEKINNLWQNAKVKVKRFFTKEGLIDFYNWNVVEHPYSSGFIVALIIVAIWKIIF